MPVIKQLQYKRATSSEKILLSLCLQSRPFTDYLPNICKTMNLYNNNLYKLENNM